MFLKCDIIKGEDNMLKRGKFCYLEVGIFFSLLMAYMWVIMPLGKEVINYFFLVFLVIFTVASHFWHRVGLKKLGIRLDNFFPALKILMPVTLTVVCLFLATGWLLKSVRLNKGFMISLITYPVWGMVQQYALQSFVNVRLKDVVKNEYLAAFVCAVLFAAVHLPNMWLTAFCFIGGYFISFFFGRRPNLFAAGIVHGVLATSLSHSVSKSILHGMVVGPGYYR